MPLILGALYDALRAANVSDDKARLAAEEVASYESRLAAIENHTQVLKWMVGTNIVLTIGVLVRLFAA